MYYINNIAYGSHPGSILIYTGITSPSGWLICDGSPISRTTYSTLFSLIGTRYGIGDNSTTFNLPDLRNKYVFSPSNPTQLNNSINGSNAVSLSVDNIPSHYHNYQDAAFASGSSGSLAGMGAVDYDNEFWYRTTTNSYTGDKADSATFLSTSSIGSGTSFSILPTYIQMNFIIKY